MQKKSSTHVSVWSYPLAYPYRDDSFVAAATDDIPGSSPLLELYVSLYALKIIISLNALFNVLLRIR